MKFLSPILAVFLVVFASAGQVSAQKKKAQPVEKTDAITLLSELLAGKRTELKEITSKNPFLLENNFEDNSTGDKNSVENRKKLIKEFKSLQNDTSILSKSIYMLNVTSDKKNNTIDSLSKVSDEKGKALKEKDDKLIDCEKNLDIKIKENKVQLDKITELQTSLTTLMKQKIESVKNSVEILTNGTNFALSVAETQKKSIESEIGSLRKVADSDLSAQLDFMTNKLNDFYSACKALDFAAGVLNNDLNKIKINEALDGLSNVLSKTSVKGFQSEHNRYHTLLRDYCKNYDEASKYSKFIDYQLETKEEKLNQIRIAKGKFASYPYILDQFRKKEASLSYKMLFNAKCN